MQDTPFYIVDISELINRVSRGDRFPPAIYETWIANKYTKNWGVPCVSTTLLDMDPTSIRTFSGNREQIVMNAQEQGVNPIDFLPAPDQLWHDERGIWLLVKDSYLLMGDGRAIKKLWRNLYS